MSTDTHPTLPSIVSEIEWMTEALKAGFVADQPVDGELLDSLVEHLRNVRQLAELIEDELAVSRNVLSEMRARSRAMAATVHPGKDTMQ